MSKVLSSSRRAPPEPSTNLQEATRRVLQAADKPLRVAFLARAINALAELTPQLDESSLGNATGARSNYGVLLSVLETPIVEHELEGEDLLAPARIRGIRARWDLLQESGPPLTAGQAASLLHITRQAVDKRRQAKQLLALTTGRRGYLYPSWQFDGEGVLAGFPRALQAIDTEDPWGQASFFLDGNIYLGGASPLAELRLGNVDAVLRAASAYGEHGAP